MTPQLYREIKDEVRNRTDWETAQAQWYTMRFTGVGRSKKPYPGAPNTHYPLIDTMIDKLRPFYLAQIYGQERAAAFTSQKPQSDELTSLAEKFFDGKLKQQTNFERAIFTATDHMLMYGRGPVKIYWDAKNKKLTFAPIRPIYIIVPSWTEELCDADWLVHVMHLSERQYRDNDLFEQGDDFIKSIKGKGHQEGGTVGQEQDILKREGITAGLNKNQIVVWEVYSREKDGAITVETISPILGASGKPVREAFGLPYKHGEIPVVDLRYEITDADYYSPRGVAEILAQHELDLCKLWNHKLQHLDYHGQPMFENAGTIGNIANFSAQPGEILPQGIKPVQGANAPLDFQQEMTLQRSLAEDRIQIPDLSNNQHDLSGKKGAQSTATGIQAIMAQSGAGNDMRSRIFRLQLAAVYRQGWSITCQYDKEKLQLDDFTQVPAEVLHDEYKIDPSGSADSFSKEKRVAKAAMYLQVMTGRPGVKEAEMTKWAFEQDDADLAKRLYEEPAEQQADQAEAQASELVLMLNGFTPRVKPEDDDKTHVITGAQWVQNKMQAGEPIMPDMAQRLLDHGAAHAEQISKKQDKEGEQVLQQVAPISQILEQIVGLHQQIQQGPTAPPQEQAAPAPAIA